MSHRLPGPSIAMALLLLVGGLAAPLFARPVAAYGERVYDANTVIGPGDPSLSVYRDQTIAQSFTPTKSFTLLNLTLRLLNRGGPTNAITVSIRPDDPVAHVPSSTILASRAVVAPNGVVNLTNVPFSPAPDLLAGQVYWIVATNTASTPTNGYDWYDSGGDVYARGYATVYDTTNPVWAILPTDMYFVSYGRDLETNVSLALTADRARANVKDLVTFTIYFNNSATQSAPTVWINESLPAGLTFVSDTSTSGALPSSTPYPAYTFSNVPNGVHSFTITTRVDVGVAPGTTLTNVVTLAYSNQTGGVHTGLVAQASIFIGEETKQLYLAPNSALPYRLTAARPTGTTTYTATIDRGKEVNFALAPVLTRPFRVLQTEAWLFVDSQSHKVQSLQIELSLMAGNGTLLAFSQKTVTTDNKAGYELFSFPFPQGDYTFPTRDLIQLRIRNSPNSTDGLVVAYNSTLVPSRLDLLTTTYVSIDALEVRDASGPATTWTSLDPLAVRANVSDPFGSDRIADARINITAPSGALVVTWASMSVLGVDPSNPSGWKLFEYILSPPLENGTYRVDVVAIEDNGVVDEALGSAEVRSPNFTFAKVASVLRARAGESFAYYLWFNNTGPAPASRVWINDTLPGPLTYVGASDVPTGNYNWSWADVGTGSRFLEIDVQVSNYSEAAWVTNVATLTFADEKGNVWPSLTRSADVVLNGPVISLGLSSQPSSGVHANESVTFTFTLRNTGDAAQSLWLNNKLPAGFAYVSDTASTYGGNVTVIGETVLFRFTDMPAGETWTVDLVARAPPALSRNATLLDLADLTYTSVNGLLMPPGSSSLVLVALAPEIGAASLTAPGQVVPGEIFSLTVVFENQGNEPARNAWVNLSFDPLLAFVNASETAISQPSSLVFALPNVTLGVHEVIVWLQVNPSTPDRRVLGMGGSVTFADGHGNVLPSAMFQPAAVQVAAPALAISVSPSNLTVEAGTDMALTLYSYNAGSGTAGDVWLNLSLPATFDYVADTAFVTPSVLGDLYVWHWMNQGPGTVSFTLILAAKPTVPNGTVASLPFRLDYKDIDGYSRPSINATARVRFIAPVVTVSATVDRTEAPAGNALTYTLRVTNVGMTTARLVWLVDAVDPRLEIVSYVSRFRATGNQTLNWTIPDLVPGGEEVLTLTVRIADGVPTRSLLSNVLEVTYTNSVGVTVGYARSEPVTVMVVADVLPLVLILGAGVSVGGLLVAYVYRRSRVDIEEVFLVYRDGVLISHLSRTILQDRDEDVLSGMLTAVQEFVRDAFQYGQHRELHQMEFGDYRILIERGKSVYLAVVYSGRDSSAVRKKVRLALDRIEDVYGQAFETWDGDMERVVGARDIIREYLLGSNGHSRSRGDSRMET